MLSLGDRFLKSLKRGGRRISDGIPNSLNEMDRIACFPSRNFLRIHDDEKPFFLLLPSPLKNRTSTFLLNRGNEGEKFRENTRQQSPPSEINRWNSVFNPFSRISLIFFLRHAFSLHSLARRFFEIVQFETNIYIYIYVTVRNRTTYRLANNKLIISFRVKDPSFLLSNYPSDYYNLR